MKLRQKTLCLFLLLTLSFSACGEEEVVTNSMPEAPPAELLGYIMVHLEPHSLEELPMQWGYLKELVALSDEYDYKLTLSFTANWAEFLLEDEEALGLLQEWEEDGHEISVHHHGVSHATWDGYTNLASYKKDPRYKGDIEVMMALIDQLSASGRVLSGSMTDAETDWPTGLLYKSYGTPADKMTNIMSVPIEENFLDQSVMTLTKSGYLTGKAVDVELNDIENAVLTATGDFTLGIALSDDNFGNDGVMEGIEELYQMLNENEVKIISLAFLIETHPAIWSE